MPKTNKSLTSESSTSDFQHLYKWSISRLLIWGLYIYVDYKAIPHQVKSFDDDDDYFSMTLLYYDTVKIPQYDIRKFRQQRVWFRI